MTRPLRPVTDDDLSHILLTIDYLKLARDHLRKAGARQSWKYVKAALKSTEGAYRHACRPRS